MRSIWVRAGFGALAVFALGMMLYTAVRSTKNRARQALLELKSELDSGATVAFNHLDRGVPFVLDGRKLGQLTSLTLSPGSANSAPVLSAAVRLDRDQLDPTMLATCDLVPLNPDHFEVSQGFRCAGVGEKGLHSLGQVRFEPVGVVRPVRADRAALAQLRQRGTLDDRLLASRRDARERHRRQRRARQHQGRQQWGLHPCQRWQGQGGELACRQERAGGKSGLERGKVGRDWHSSGADRWSAPRRLWLR